MKKVLSIALILALALCLGAGAFAAGTHTVTLINGMDGSVYETYEVADGEDFVFSISGSPPCDMGPIADGEAGSGVFTTGGKIVYSNVTLGGPNQYPTAETVTISGITKDIDVTVTPNPAEVDSEFPAITLGELAGGSGEASGDASGEASSDEPYPLFDEYKEYLFATLMQDEFWQGNEAVLRADIDAAETPNDENILHFTGTGAVDQAPAGVVFPLPYDLWYAENAGEAVSVEDAYIEYLHEWLIAEDEVNDTMTEDIRENEFMPLIYAWDFESFPAEMLWGDMLINGNPMTFEEFAAQYEPAAPAAGGYTADEDGYKAYLKDWVAANPAVQANIDEFNAAIEAGAYGDFPLEMCFTDQWFGFAALTLDQFVAAGGAAEIPAFDPNLAPD